MRTFRYLMMLIGCTIGAILCGVSIRGGSWSAFSFLLLAPMVFVLIERSSLVETAILSSLFGLFFYANAFMGLLSPWDGAFGPLWMLLTVAFTLLQVIACLVGKWMLKAQKESAWLIVPIWFTSFEYVRHLLTKLYDGNGLTFCCIGQSLVDQPLILQCADIGGVWLLSFLVAFGSSAIASSFTKQSGRSRSLLKINAATVLYFAFAGYGLFRLSQPQGVACGHVVLFPEGIGSRNLLRSKQEIQRSIEQIRVAAKSEVPWFCLVSSEAAIAWFRNDLNPAEMVNRNFDDQNTLLQTSLELNAFAVVGAWVQSSNATQYRNAAVIMNSGRVVSIVDKQNQIPIAEGSIYGENWYRYDQIEPLFMHAARIHQTASSNVALWQDQSIPVVPCICYDLFFPETIHRFGHLPKNGAIVCCLGEGFDLDGIFQDLLLVNTKLRAVGFRRPVVRCSDVGVNGVFDSNGFALKPELESDDFLFCNVPGGDRKSLYAQWGNWFPKLCVALTFLSFLRAIRRIRFSKQIKKSNGVLIA